MIYVNLKTFTLSLRVYIDEGWYHESVKCGIGKPSTPTPKGIFMVKRKITDPKSYYTLNNPEKYGSCVLELNIFGHDDRDGEMRPYCIHGNESDDLLGTQHTMGCITLKEDALKWTFNCIEKGEKVVIWDCDKDDVMLRDIPNWRQIRVWPPPENSVSYRRNKAKGLI